MFCSKGSILGPLLFNIFLSDLLLFFDNTYIACSSDNTSSEVHSEPIQTSKIELFVKIVDD